ncbi:hypothetical protein [Nocardioides yefusunii]|uniref:WD40 repeat domain-containing protein n=1 Tax=Nocardioides yefusunii TaxID=2500546 RepID=A0ABW1QVW5_9ACTN|nr:hypothetical protein [Nocardioides yefusunii]
MNTLEDRLGHLSAATEEPVGVAPTDALWSRGRRRVHARRAVACVAGLVLVGVLGSLGAVSSGLTRTEAMPVSAENGVVLPSSLAFDMPEALPELGAGEASAVGLRQRQTGRLFWAGHVNEIVGVQATTGTYGVIDTPGLVADGVDGVRLSPSGRYVAYWVGDEAHDGAMGTVADAVAVRDLVTGTLVEQDLEAEFGAAVDPAMMEWIDDDQLLVNPLFYDDEKRNGAGSDPERMFTLGVDGERRLIPATRTVWPESNVVDGRYLGQTESQEWVVLDSRTWATEAVSLPSAGDADVRGPWWDGDDRVAALLDPSPEISGDNDLRVAFGDVGVDAGPVEWRDSGAEVPDWSTFVGWRDGGVVVNRGLALDVVTEQGAIEEWVTLREGDGSVDTSDWDRGGVVQHWEFALEVLADVEIVDAVTPEADAALRMLRTLPIVALGALLVALIGYLFARRARRGNA